MDNPTMNLIKDEHADIPFVDVLVPYTQGFVNELKKTNISAVLINKLHIGLLNEMSSVAEVTLQDELNDLKKNGLTIYSEFVETMYSTLAIKYPVLNKILKTVVNNYLIHIQNIFSNFSKDLHFISKTFSLALNSDITIKDINLSLGDGHGGESTASVTLSNDTKLIYKPRNIDTAKSYNVFIDWINQKLNINLKILRCLNYEHYGWLEFADHHCADSLTDLQEYYQKAGVLLAVTLLLGSKDCHYENVIASGKNPVIIDHETIIQPVLSQQSIRTWDEHHKIAPFSVLESMLIINKNTGVPTEYAGYGIKGNIEIMDLEKKVMHPNTIDSKRDTRFVFRKLVKENIPFYEDKHLFAGDYRTFFIEGFTKAYDLFVSSKDELMSSDSPIQGFKKQKIRYVWRPTFVYFRILKYMRSSVFMKSFEAYESKLYELMSKAYQKADCENYKFILNHEMQQMLKGDIPFFNLDSQDHHLGGNGSFKIFSHNCTENIEQRINLFSTKHKEEQIEFINNWLNINTSV